MANLLKLNDKPAKVAEEKKVEKELPTGSALSKMLRDSEALIHTAEKTEQEMNAYYSEMVDESSEVSDEDVEARTEALRNAAPRDLAKASLALFDELLKMKFAQDGTMCKTAKKAS